MDIRRLTPDFAISAQITIKDVAQLKNMGFQSIICNRPNGEETSQPSFEMIETAAELANMQASFQPLAPTGPVEGDMAAFKAAVEKLPKPILAYCRSGGRSQAAFRLAFD